LQNSTNLRFSIFVSSSSSGKYPSQTKPQELVMVTIIAITRSWCTTSILTMTDHQKARTKITEDLHSKQTPGLPTTGLTKQIREAELPTEVVMRPRPLHIKTPVLHVPWQRDQTSHQRLPHLYRHQMENEPRHHSTFTTTTTQRSQPHHAMGSA
jgi:hypothetical protein